MRAEILPLLFAALSQVLGSVDTEKNDTYIKENDI